MLFVYTNENYFLFGNGNKKCLIEKLKLLKKLKDLIQLI